ncbi:basic amino acid ABC transporter substrate-binding protein [Oceanobacillus caeni]|uniref:ABC transporter substrate-binding protein n=1 Tax=Oceanobacillus caeni TaxID=405946 RepID=A0ABR5MMA0_9BACI|nr:MULTISPECIES: basic amino acid ABC transporter substrate-binding protein [Bacillaceae]KKE80759.1 ABC transporter substrate-binding protein [Bacilli bacterium VT-13-104]PZD83130.1 basic amino acid ABC transporter substrate-binding protein [Bacilli bacterium]KPH77609.1 ABC transporter substrate-binding protein [Oceanobacillus caeni]MBU8791939.1 basic amino acid ABC transporter substrate-binding protein [Oceanobacillus caeni]MCR1835996.1 basic amino acid ABC transporter substrate-binding prote
MKSTFFKILVMAFIIGVLAACGAGDPEAEKTPDNNTGDTATDSQEGEKAEKADGKVLKMATSADFPPFESYDKEGNFVGFDIEVAQAIADELGYELEIQDMSFDGLIGALQSGRVDMVMSGMSATEERKQNVDFSEPYHRSGEMFIMKKDADINSLEDLKGLTVGVQLGTIQEEGADELSSKYGFEVKKVDKAALLIQELNSNRIDVGYLDKTVAEGFIAEQGLEGFDDPTTSSPGMGIAFPKGSELTEEINGALEKLIENGTIAELEKKWDLTNAE